MRAAAGDLLPTRTVEMTRERIAAYAAASGDRNPIHLDEEFARSVGLPGVIAHGMLDMGLVGTLIAGWAGDPRRLRSLRCRFAGMVRPGDRVTFGGRVQAVEGGMATLEFWAETQDGERVLSKGVASVVLDPGASQRPS